MSHSLLTVYKMETEDMTITETFEYLDGCIDAFEANTMNKTEFLSSANELVEHLKLKILNLIRKYPKIKKKIHHFRK